MGLSRYALAFLLIFAYSNLTTPDSNLAFSFKNFGKDSNFGSQIALFGDAKVDSGSRSVQISGSRLSSSPGRVMFRKPINLVDGKVKQMVSMSTSFGFSMSGNNGGGLSFVMLPAQFPLNVSLLKNGKIKIVGVEFHAVMKSNHFGLDVRSVASDNVSNVSSSINLVPGKNVEKFQAWIDYKAGNKTLEVWLTKFGKNKPVDPLLSHSIDVSKLWKEEKVVVGFCGNSSQKVNLYSWSFEARTLPKWMHSQPLDPDDLAKEMRVGNVVKEAAKVTGTRSDCRVRIVGALVLGIGCGALVALSVLFAWSLFGSRQGVVYKKFDVAGDCKEMESGKWK